MVLHRSEEFFDGLQNPRLGSWPSRILRILRIQMTPPSTKERSSCEIARNPKGDVEIDFQCKFNLPLISSFQELKSEEFRTWENLGLYQKG